MGIAGLLPVLKSITETKTIDQYKGQTLAIDGYCWLHRAIYSCSQEICLGEDTDKYIIYFTDRVHALRQNGITPYVVFDGGPLPMKKGTEEERRASRAKNRELGIQSLQQKDFAAARKYFVRAADVTPYMAHRVIRQLRAMNVQYVVAPYEADAQLAFLMKNGLVDGVITEDSDCLPFGCAKVLFKMDRDGIAQEVRTDNLKRNDGLSFHMFTDDMFLEMCIFSGCDYLPSLPGFGLKKAYALVKQHGSYAKILRALRMEGKVRIPPTYEADFERALLTFHHQRVFDPQSKHLVPLTPIPPELLDKGEAMDFLGPIIPHEIARGIAEGDLDPMTHLPFTDPPSSRLQNVQSFRAQTPAGPRKTTLNGFTARKPHAMKSPSKAALPPPQPTTRNLPAWMSRKASQFSAKTPSPPPAPAPSAAPQASTPKTISHFFAARQAKFSPTDDATKAAAPKPASLSRQQSTDSTYESQDPSEVDVARSISFSPMNDDVKQMRRDGATEDKENAAPNESTRSAPTENAFARMMRAGTMLQKHTLKRKAPAGSFARSTTGRLMGGVVGHQRQETPMERIKRLAFTSQPTSDGVTEPSTPLSCLTPAEPEREPVSEDVEDEIASQQCVVRSSVLSERLVVKEVGQLHDKTHATVGPKPASQRPPVAGDAFARFRFGTK